MAGRKVQDQFIVRFPDGMRDHIAEAAKANGRSMNAEIVARLEGSFQDSLVPELLAKSIDALNARLDRIEGIMPRNALLAVDHVLPQTGPTDDQPSVTSDPSPRRVGSKRIVRGFPTPKPPKSDR